jgi:hypothetical protein
MSRATTKNELIKAANRQFDKLWQLINSTSGAEQNAAFDFDGTVMNKKGAHWGRDKNLRDVLAHLYEWHQLLLEWVKANMGGEKKPFLPAPYNWKTYSQMNVGFWEKHQNTPYDKAQKMLEASHKQTTDLIDSFSDGELFTKNHFSWTGTASLGSYCVSVTASHYDWAINKLKAANKKK